MKHLNIKIYGLVQGVAFRATAKFKAESLDIAGFVKNENDGSVYIEAEGGEGNLAKFIEWCKVGPQLAKVEKIEVTESELKHFQHFQITH